MSVLSSRSRRSGPASSAGARFAAGGRIRLVFPQSTTVRVLAVDGTAVQVEILDGPLVNKRGWGLASAFAPDL